MQKWGLVVVASSLLVVVLLAAAPIRPAIASGNGADSVWATPNLVLPSGIHPLGEVCSTTALCPATVLSAYGFGGISGNSSRNGTGQAVVIVDACGDSSIASDLSKFDSTNHLAPAALNVYHPQGTPCSATGSLATWSLETALDVEWAHVIAPNATIQLVVAAQPTTKDLFGAWNYSLAHSLGNEISNSWGGTGGCGSTPSGLLTKASSAHVTILASAGDSGAWGFNQTLGSQTPADCKAIVTVGGTSLSVTSGGAYSSESAWSSSGGGYVTGKTEPSYQKTAGIKDFPKLLGKPDVAAVADPSTGVWVYNTLYGWVVVGGTSVSCPLWAAFLADTNSWRAVNGFNAVGSLDPYLYLHVYGAGGGSTNYSKTIHDVKTGNNGWAAGTGWDAATGIGSFKATALAGQLANDSSA